MNPPSSAFRELKAKVTIHQQKFFPIIIRCVHHLTFTSPAVSSQELGARFAGCDRRSDFRLGDNTPGGLGSV
jgi:hypothetical protein